MGYSDQNHLLFRPNIDQRHLPHRTISTTVAARFCMERIDEEFLFAKINKQICRVLLMMENILYVWKHEMICRLRHQFSDTWSLHGRAVRLLNGPLRPNYTEMLSDNGSFSVTKQL